MSFNTTEHNISRHNKNSRWMVRSSNPGRGKSVFSETSIPAVWPTQPPIQWVPGLFPGYIGHVVKLTTHPHLVSRLKMSRTISLLLLYAFMAWTGKTCLQITGKHDEVLLIWNKNAKECFPSVTSGLKCDFLLAGMPNR